MNAVPVIKRLDDCSGLLTPDFDFWAPEEILNYFQSRSHIQYFAIADENQIGREKIDAILTHNRFDFNGESYQFKNSVDWLSNPSCDIEWAIMLHKFYYAVGLGIAFQETGDGRYVNKWMALTSQWIHSVPVDYLSADVTGRRVQNWIFAHYYFVTTCQANSVTPEFYQLFLKSIHQQVSFLCKNLTPARNHRTLELYTIFLAAVVFPEIRSANDWLTFSIDELVTNIKTDILPDGVHCELSTDYHHIVLRNFLAVKRLAVLNNITLPVEFDIYIKKALDFSVYAHKPDGMIPSLSDGDTGSFLNLLTQGYVLYGDETLQYVATLGKQGTAPSQRCKAFNDGGYYILRSGWGNQDEDYQDERYLIFDCGPVGAGNHGHLDLLSFEMAAYGRSLIVDPGRYTYDESGEINWRVLFRGTSYHNTVTVDGLNQTKYEFHKKKFKIVGEHPYFELKNFVSHPGFDYLHGIAFSHEYPIIHERKIIFVAGEYWLICDVLRANEPHQYDLNFHLSALAQDNIHSTKNKHCVTVSSPHLLIAQPSDDEVALSITPGYVSQTYGLKQAAPIVTFCRTAGTYSFYTVLYPFKTDKPELTVSRLPILNDAGNYDSMRANYLEITVESITGTSKDRIFIANHPGKYVSGKKHFTQAISIERLSGRQFQLNTTDFPPQNKAYDDC